jgi:hypothetical protein
MADVIETDYTTDPPTVVERDFTAEEKAQRAVDLKAYKAAEKAAAEALKARDAALEKLMSLGLTMDDLDALGIR